VIMVGRAPALSQLRRLTPPSLPHITGSLPALPGIHGLTGRHPGDGGEPGAGPDPRRNGHHAGDAHRSGQAPADEPTTPTRDGG
jgi:hypothetical protein